MGITAPTNKDLTHYSNAMSPGLSISKMCFSCNRPRPSADGRTDKRTRMWYCAACVPLKFKDDNAR